MFFHVNPKITEKKSELDLVRKMILMKRFLKDNDSHIVHLFYFIGNSKFEAGKSLTFDDKQSELLFWSITQIYVSLSS